MHEPEDSYGLQWRIPSRSDPNSCYVVDIGLPRCQCTFWDKSVGPKLYHGEKVTQWCWHYKEARRRHADWSIKKFTEYRKQMKQEEEQ